MSILYTLHKAEQVAAELWAEHTKAAGIGGTDGLTLRQMALLEAIFMAPDCSQTRLVEITCVDRSTVAAIVKTLVTRGLVKRRRLGDDRRAWSLRLTDAGAELYRRGLAVRRDVEAEAARRVRGLAGLTVLLVAAHARPKTHSKTAGPNTVVA